MDEKSGIELSKIVGEALEDVNALSKTSRANTGSGQTSKSKKGKHKVNELIKGSKSVGSGPRKVGVGFKVGPSSKTQEQSAGR